MLQLLQLSYPFWNTLQKIITQIEMRSVYVAPTLCSCHKPPTASGSVVRRWPRSSIVLTHFNFPIASGIPLPCPNKLISSLVTSSSSKALSGGRGSPPLIIRVFPLVHLPSRDDSIATDGIKSMLGDWRPCIFKSWLYSFHITVTLLGKELCHGAFVSG